ncbi:rhomboid family intramembrane serine protease [Hyphococcus lacteus]|uniref:Rhomboid family intramembrane serine protease n=1 Tax=Hyphococcus lacteus TaxID=3143536 RepID=A0ABV3Z654_9PROT
MRPQTDRNDWLGFFKNPPDTVTVIVTGLAVIQIIMSLLPVAAVRRIWRLVELSPARMMHALDKGDILTGMVRPILGHMLFHVNVTHMVVNLLALGMMGTVVFREMESAPETKRHDIPVVFTAFLLLSGMFAGVFFVLINQDSWRAMIGASGAAAGLFGAIVWISFMRPDNSNAKNTEPQATIIPLLMMLGVSILIIAATIFFDTSKLSFILFKSASAWQAHVGGYLFGLLTYPLFERLAAVGH